jgi:hypothetical protein
MNKLVYALAVVGILGSSASASAQGMMGNWGTAQPVTATTTVDTAQTAQDEAAGKAIWDKLQAKQTTCDALKDDDFDVLGDYFMGLMSGANHAAMNANMTARMGADGEKQMHIALGKRMSGCDTGATTQLTPMMQNVAFGGMMGGNQWYGTGHGMMNGFSGFSAFGITHVVTTGLIWIALILAIIVLAQWLFKKK